MIRAILVALLYCLAISSASSPASAQDQSAEIAAAKQVAETFLGSMKKANRVDARPLVAATARDEFDARFDKDSKRLTAGPKPRFIFAAPLKSHSLDPIEYEATLLYAAKQDGDWTTVKLRLYRFDQDPYRVEYWKIENKAPDILALSDDPALRSFPSIMRWVGLGLALGGMLLIGVILWLVRRKPRLVAPENPVETRPVAITRRDGAG